MRPRTTALAVSLLVTAVGLTACNANPKSAATTSGSGGGSATAAASKGGTLRLFAPQQEIHFDPAKSQILATSAGHLVFRSLTTWKTSPNGSTQVVPDLATTTGAVSDGGKTWTFHLKSGLKYSDGTAITSADIKFGVERSFDAQLQGGLSYHKGLLVGGATYTGPAKGKHLDSIQTPDASTVVFHLTRPFVDWSWIASMPAFAPIPAAKGMGIPAYDHKPPSSGPYQVSSYVLGSQVTFVRNKYWVQSTDPVRTAAPNQIVEQMGLNPDTLAQQMVADQGTSKDGAGAAITTSIIPKINADPSVKARTTVSPSGAESYLAMNSTRPGLSSVNVRKAIEYAINKQSLQTIAGGPTYGGKISTTLIPPGVQGYQKYDLYPAPATGDPAKAKTLLGTTKVPTLTLVYDSTDPKESRQAASVQADLKKIGITVKPVGQDTDTLANTQTETNNFDLTFGGWQADYPGAYAQLQPVFASDQVGNGNYNIAKFKNAQVDAAIDTATSASSPEQATSEWAKVDRQIMALAPVVPLYYNHQAYLNGSNVTGTYIPSFPTYPNVLIQGLKK